MMFIMIKLLIKIGVLNVQRCNVLSNSSSVLFPRCPLKIPDLNILLSTAPGEKRRFKNYIYQIFLWFYEYYLHFYLQYNKLD